MARRSPVRRGLPSVVVALLVVALTVAVGALVVLALQRGQGDGVDPASRPAPTVGLTPPASSPSPSESPAAIAPPDADERFLAVDADMMWRATAGRCDGPAPVVERSDDDGDTWVDVTPTYRDIMQIRALTPFAETQADLVADLGDDCETQALRTFTEGTFWSPYDDLLPVSTYLTAESLVIDGATVEAPCAQPWGLRASGGIAAFICDGTAYAVADGETTEIGTGVLALDVLDGDIVGATMSPDCDGIQVATLAPESAPIDCLTTDATGPVALALTSDTVRVWVGDQLLSTTR